MKIGMRNKTGLLIFAGFALVAHAEPQNVRVPTRPESWIEVGGLGGASKIQNVHLRLRENNRIVFWFEYENEPVEIRETKLRAHEITYEKDKLRLWTYRKDGSRFSRAVDRLHLDRIDRRHLVPQMFVTAVVTFAASVGIPDLVTSTMLSATSLGVLVYLAQLWSRPAGFSFRACELSLVKPS